jgi:hypothetical protein
MEVVAQESGLLGFYKSNNPPMKRPIRGTEEISTATFLIIFDW